MGPLDQVAAWPVGHVAIGVTDREAVLDEVGPADESFALASVTKVLTALAVLVACEEETIGLDEPAGPPGSTVRHLLAHASGLGLDAATSLVPPGTRRVYSNAGYDLLGELVAARSGITFPTYLRDAILGPLGMARTELRDGCSPAAAATSTVRDLLAIGRELLAPTLLAGETHAVATQVAFPGLAGVLPGFGPRDPNDWGLGLEIRGRKWPHWTGTRNDPATFGHFGRSGTFLWVDPRAGLACACLTDRDFGPWAIDAWPPLADAVLARWPTDARGLARGGQDPAPPDRRET